MPNNGKQIKNEPSSSSYANLTPEMEENTKKYAEIKEEHTLGMTRSFKGELVDQKYGDDFASSPKLKKENPYKTPPNNLTTKDRGTT